MKHILGVLVLGLALVGCGGNRDGASCADRVAAVKARLASPRSLDEIRRDASPALRRALDEADRAGASTGRATALAGQLEPMVAACPPAAKVFGEVGGLGPDVDKGDHVRGRLPPALEECACQASPEDVGGLFEAILAEWKSRR